MLKIYVSLLTTAAVPNAMTLVEVQEATLNDPTLQKLAELIRSQQWHSILTSKPYSIMLPVTYVYIMQADLQTA